MAHDLILIDSTICSQSFPVHCNGYDLRLITFRQNKESTVFTNRNLYTYRPMANTADSLLI